MAKVLSAAVQWEEQQHLPEWVGLNEAASAEHLARGRWTHGDY